MTIRSVGLQDILWVDLIPPGESKLPLDHKEFAYNSGQSFSVFMNWSRVGRERLEDRKKNPPSPTSLATESYYTTALEYFHQEDKDGDALGDVMRVTHLKQGAVGLFGLNMAVASIGDLIILSAVPAGVMMTIEERSVPFPREDPIGSPAFSEKRKEFSFLNGLNSSFWEYRILEVLDNVDSISATKALQAAHEKALSLLTLATGASTQEIQSFLDKLPFQIRRGVENAVGAGFEVITATSTIRIEDWTGIAYITRHPETGIGDFVISGTMGESFTLSGGGNWLLAGISRLLIRFPVEDGKIFRAGTHITAVGEAVNMRLGGDISDKIFWELFVPEGVAPTCDKTIEREGQFLCRLSTGDGRLFSFDATIPTKYTLLATAPQLVGSGQRVRTFSAISTSFTVTVRDPPQQDGFVGGIDTTTIRVMFGPTADTLVDLSLSSFSFEFLENESESTAPFPLAPDLKVFAKAKFLVTLSDAVEINPGLNVIGVQFKDRAGHLSQLQKFPWTVAPP